MAGALIASRIVGRLKGSVDYCGILDYIVSLFGPQTPKDGTDLDMLTCLHGQHPCQCGTRYRHLTRREIDVLLLVGAGLEDSAIATKLSVSVTTIQAHMKHMRHKAGARDRAGVITRCYAAGVLLPGSLPPQWSGTYCLRLPEDL